MGNRPTADTPMHRAWEEYKASEYYHYITSQMGWDADNNEITGILWWMFSKGYEAAVNDLKEETDG